MAKPKYSRLPTRKPSPSSTSPSSSSSSTLILTLLLFFTFLVLILLALGIVSVPSTTSPSNSNLPMPNDLTSILHNTLHTREDEEEKEGGEKQEGKGERWVEILSWEPRAIVYHNFLSKEECEHLINISKPNMQKSRVVDSKTGKSKDSRVRTSSGTFLHRGRDEIVKNIEKRISDFTFIPVDHGEGLQVLHYEVGQKYEPHYDYFLDEFSTENGGQRIATVLMYLTDVEEGGETVFPNAKGNFSSLPGWNELSDCGKKGLSIKPKRGDALLFWSIKPDATLDPLSLHGGCPVIKGNKWSSTKWIRLDEFLV